MIFVNIKQLIVVVNRNNFEVKQKIIRNLIQITFMYLAIHSHF